MKQRDVLLRSLGNREKTPEGQGVWSGWPWPTTPFGPNSERFCNRDLFPLPRLEHTAFESRLKSRKCQQRAGRRRHFTEEVNCTVDSLNSMFDAKLCGLVQKPLRPSRGQLQCLEFIQEAVEQIGVPTPYCTFWPRGP